MIETVTAIIASFGVSALVSSYDGIFGVFAKLRSHIKALNCTVCTSVYVAVPIAYFSDIGVIGYLCVIGGVILLERWS
jgi:hypothetical protein